MLGEILPSPARVKLDAVRGMVRMYGMRARAHQGLELIKSRDHIWHEASINEVLNFEFRREKIGCAN